MAARHGRALARWWTHFEQTIIHHHEREDDVIWPELERRRPEFGESRGVLEVDHHALDEAMSAVRVVTGAAADGDDPTARHGAITRFATLLVDHLRREEAAAFPLIADSFTNEEFREIEEQMSKQLSLGQSVFEIPWVLESAEPSVRALADELLPAPVRLLNRLWFTPRYRRLVATLFEDLDVVRAR